MLFEESCQAGPERFDYRRQIPDLPLRRLQQTSQSTVLFVPPRRL
jgi:hypothetical protein